MHTLPRPLRGIVPPVLTPLTDDHQLDSSGLQRILDRMLEAGVHGVFALGTTGEGPYLSSTVRHHVVDVTCDHVAGRAPVLVGISDTCFEASVELADLAYASGAAGVVATAPYYLDVGQDELTGHFQRLADRCPLPLLLYNIPSCTKTAFDPETVRKLADHDNIVGLKDSSGDLDYFKRVRQLCRECAGFSLLVGPEEILSEALQLGAHGGVHGGANIFPRLYVELYEAVMAGDTQRTAELNEWVQRVSESVYRIDTVPSRIIRGLKSAAELLGLCSARISEPFQPFDALQQGQIRERLETLLPALAPDAEIVER